MIPFEIVIVLIFVALIIACFYAKMILIWREVMLKKHDSLLEDFKKLNSLKNKLNDKL